MKPETKIRLMCPKAKNAKDCGQPPEAQRSKEGFSPEPSEGAWPCQQPGFRLPTSRTIKENKILLF